MQQKCGSRFGSPVKYGTLIKKKKTLKGTLVLENHGSTSGTFEFRLRERCLLSSEVVAGTIEVTAKTILVIIAITATVTVTMTLTVTVTITITTLIAITKNRHSYSNSNSISNSNSNSNNSSSKREP